MPSRLTPHLRHTTEPRFEKDWVRQRRTAEDILKRLQTQEGVILADQVGMGKTYVALAVAVSQILSTPELGQVVIFVPAAVADKWVREWRKFSESLLEAGSGIRCVDHPIRSGEEFLKKLDDAPKDRAHILVVTHTALTTTMKDSFVQLALLHYATRYVRGGDKLRQRIAKWSTGLNGLIRNPKFTPDRVATLLDTVPSKWHKVWLRITGEDLQDDPVPEALIKAAPKLVLEDLRAVLNTLPIRSSADISKRLENVRQALFRVTQATWKLVLSSIELELPLLIVDEAHRLKNPWTQISGLFSKSSGKLDDGVLYGIFRRMLFLTATPFELGHSELIQVLSRLDAVIPLEPLPKYSLQERLHDLEKVLTLAQVSAHALDEAWGRISESDLNEFNAWELNASPPFGVSSAIREAWEYAKLAARARQKMSQALRPWIIRHERERRRTYRPGSAIIADTNNVAGGLQIPESAALPFLLAARAQSISLDEKGARPLFAYGIASSYEAFSRLGADEANDGRDSDLSEEDSSNKNNLMPRRYLESDAVGWYRSQIDQALKHADTHPKIQATVDKALQLWLQGEKCLIFSWFIKTGEAIEQQLSKRVDVLILEQASVALGAKTHEECRLELDRLSDRVFRSDSSSYERIRNLLVDALVEDAGRHQDVLDLVVDAAIRHLRTPSYLVRYTHLSPDITDKEVWAGINGANAQRIVLLNRWRQFATRLARARNQIEAINSTEEHDSEFASIHTALLGTAAEDNNQSLRRGASLHPVRRAHGGTKRDVRERLIALFNTPFSPDLLVASSVMGEGIDLHQECRFVIHHDLDWNPSVLEQRTGRLDRIGALAEREGKTIEVYEPYLAGTHDEKMFRVVKDRAQWFDVVMGRATGIDEQATDAEELRAPLHVKIREALTMDLSSPC